MGVYNVYQKCWDSFLLDFGVQQWDFVNYPLPNQRLWSWSPSQKPDEVNTLNKNEFEENGQNESSPYIIGEL